MHFIPGDFPIQVRRAFFRPLHCCQGLIVVSRYDDCFTIDVYCIDTGYELHQTLFSQFDSGRFSFNVSNRLYSISAYNFYCFFTGECTSCSHGSLPFEYYRILWEFNFL